MLGLISVFPFTPRRVPVRRALLLEEDTFVCKAVAHNWGLAESDETTPYANTATCFDEHFSGLPLKLAQSVGLLDSGQQCRGTQETPVITESSKLEAKGRWEEYSSACAGVLNKIQFVICHFSSFLLQSFPLTVTKLTFKQNLCFGGILCVSTEVSQKIKIAAFVICVDLTVKGVE